MENDNNLKNEKYNLSFLKKIWYSICKFEKYPEMAALGVKKTVIYLTEIILIFSIIYTGIFIKHIKIKYDYITEDMTLGEQMISIVENERALSDKEKEAYDYLINEGNVSDLVFLCLLFITVLISFYLATLIDVIMLSGFGMITCFFARIKINYKALFNMSIYASTLPMFFKIIYYSITMLTSFTVKYFSTMCIAVSYISLAAAIFLIKSNIIKQHLELMKIIEEGKDKIEEKMQNLKKPKEEESKEDKDKDNEKNKEEQEEKETGSEEQGSNA